MIFLNVAGTNSLGKEKLRGCLFYSCIRVDCRVNVFCHEEDLANFECGRVSRYLRLYNLYKSYMVIMVALHIPL